MSSVADRHEVTPDSIESFARLKNAATVVKTISDHWRASYQMSKNED
jgi:hypothetical protein